MSSKTKERVTPRAESCKKRFLIMSRREMLDTKMK